MSLYSPESISEQQYGQAPASDQRRYTGDHALILSELNPRAVVDCFDGGAPDDACLQLITFGTVRETCPKCERTHLKLVLRQELVRTPHLFCADCQSCYDAHYPDGAPALTI